MRTTCYRSHNGDRKPHCRCITIPISDICQQAIILYDSIKATKLLERIQRRRMASKLARFQRTENYSNLCSDNVALRLEWIEHDIILDNLNNDRRDFVHKITVKREQLEYFRGKVAAHLPNDLMECHDSELQQLQIAVTATLTASQPSTPSVWSAPNAPLESTIFNCN